MFYCDEAKSTVNLSPAVFVSRVLAPRDRSMALHRPAINQNFIGFGLEFHDTACRTDRLIEYNY